MRILIFRLVFLLTVFPVYGASPEEVEDPAIVAKRRQIDQRIDEGDYTAFTEAAMMPTDKAISFLWWYAKLASHPGREAARAAFKKVQGVDQYFAARFAEATRTRYVDEEAFTIASAVPTPEVVAVVAPYLFDFTEVDFGEHLGLSITAFSAAVCLGKMNLPDAPETSPNLGYKVKDFVAWQQWAVDKGLVPKEWKSRVGQAKIFQQYRAIDQRSEDPTPEPTATPLAASTPTPEPLSTPMPATPVPAILALPPLTPSSETPLWPWVAGILVISALLVTALKRR